MTRKNFCENGGRFRRERDGQPHEVVTISPAWRGPRTPAWHDAMFLQHQHEHLGVDDRASVKQFHAGNLITDGHARQAEVGRGNRTVKV